MLLTPTIQGLYMIFVFPTTSEEPLHPDCRYKHINIKSIYINSLPYIIANNINSKTIFIFYEFSSWHHIVYSVYTLSFSCIDQTSGMYLTHGNNPLNHVTNNRLMRFNIFLLIIIGLLDEKMEDVFMLNNIDKTLVSSKLTLKKKKL